jgi:DNA-binding LytR/AlgR family response regulator
VLFFFRLIERREWLKKILLIEDDVHVRSTIKELLENNNYTVFAAVDGKEGIQLAQEIHPNLIISDIMMPRLDGYDVIKALKKDPQFIDIPFVFLTAKAEISDFREGMDLGADDYLTKPFRASGLLKLVENKLLKYDLLRRQKVVPAKKKEKKDALTENDKMFINVKNKPQIIRVGDILFIKAEGEYSNIHLVSGTEILKRKLVKEWELQLPDNIFLRIHRSTIINLNYLEKIEKWYNRSYVIYLKNHPEKFVVSQRFASKLKSNYIL